MAFLKKKNEYDDYYMSLNEKELSASKISFIEMDDKSDILSLGKSLMNGTPLVINFEGLANVNEMNKALAFLSGVVFAYDGMVEEIKDYVYIFACKNELLDGSLNKFIEELI